MDLETENLENTQTDQLQSDENENLQNDIPEQSESQDNTPTPEAEEDLGLESETSEPDDNSNMTKSMSKRVAKLKNSEQAALARAAEAERKLAQMEQRLNGDNSQQAQDQNNNNIDPANMTIEQLDNLLEQREQVKAQRAQEREMQQKMHGFYTDLSDRIERDEELGELVNTHQNTMTDAMGVSLIDSEVKNKPALLKYLLKNKAEKLRDIARSNPLQQYSEIQKLATEYEQKLAARKTSNAPNPVDEINGKKTSIPSDPNNMSMDQLEALLAPSRN